MAQRGSFLDHLRIGFGGGANSSQVVVKESYNIFEDLTGTTYNNGYSGMLQNIGNQYFVQVEWFNDFIILTYAEILEHNFKFVNSS